MMVGLYSTGVRFETLREAVGKVTFGAADGIVRELAGQVKVTKKSARRPRAKAQGRSIAHRKLVGAAP